MKLKELAEVMSDGSFVAVQRHDGEFVFSGSVDIIRRKNRSCYWVEKPVAKIELSVKPKFSATIITLG